MYIKDVRAPKIDGIEPEIPMLSLTRADKTNVIIEKW